MSTSEELAHATRLLIGEMTPREAADLAGTSHQTIYELLRGRQTVSRRLVGQIADRLKAPRPVRARLFAAAGYMDTQAPPVLTPEAESLAHEFTTLPEEDRDTLRRLMQDKRLLSAARLFLDSRVISGATGRREAIAA